MEDYTRNSSSSMGGMAVIITSSLLPDNISSSTTTMGETLTAAVVVPDNAETLRVVRYAVQKVCVPVVVCLGVVGNILNMVVLTRRSMMNSTNCYLAALAAFDILYLVFSLTLSLKHYDGFDRNTVYVHWFPYGRVLTDMAANVSVLLTITFTVERYIGVCHPMKGRIICTPQRAKIVSALVAFVAVSCTVPELFEMEVVWKTDSALNHSYPAWQYTDFSSTYSYQIGYYWFFVTVFTFLPLVLLCIFNGILIASLFRAAELRTRMTSSSPSRLSERYSREQQWITKMLVTVVLVFILCQLPGALLLLIWSYNELAEVHVTPVGRNQLLIAGNVTNLLIQINASINFILYSMTSTKFRRVFWRTLCSRKSSSSSRSYFLSGRSSTFKNGIPLTSFASGSVRHTATNAAANAEVPACSHASNNDSRHSSLPQWNCKNKKPQLRLLIKHGNHHKRPHGGDKGNRKWAAAHAWKHNASDVEGGISPSTETCYTDTEREL